MIFLISGDAILWRETDTDEWDVASPTDLVMWAENIEKENKELNTKLDVIEGR